MMKIIVLLVAFQAVRPKNKKIQVSKEEKNELEDNMSGMVLSIADAVMKKLQL